MLPGGRLHAARIGSLDGKSLAGIRAALAPLQGPTCDGSAVGTAAAAGGNALASNPVLSSIERQVLAEFNLARQDPGAYIAKLKAYRSQINGRSGATRHTGSDGSSPADRLARYGKWQGTMGENIAYGGETDEEFVFRLIVDDGAASRGHRKNIFNADFLAVGIAAGEHPGYRTVFAMEFAGAYTEGSRPLC